jgi:hypothetical protein
MPAVIILELNRLIRNGRPCDAELAVRVRADGREISVDGPEPELIDRNQTVLSLRNGRSITCDDDPEEWARGLAVSFRSPYLSSRVVEDTNPLPDGEVAPTNVREPS